MNEWSYLPSFSITIRVLNYVIDSYDTGSAWTTRV